MGREIEVSLNEKEFLLGALKLNTRIDGRAPFDLRPFSVSIDKDLGRYGQAEVLLGKTRVLASVSAEITRPYADRPSEGILNFATHFSPNASPIFDTVGRPSETEIVVSRLLERIFRKTRAIETEGLCILAGEKVWSVKMDIHVLDHDGNVVDACCAAALAAFMHFKRPEVSVYENETVIVHSFDDKSPVPLSIRYYPISVSFALFSKAAAVGEAQMDLADDAAGEEYILLDPTRLEERLSQGELVMVMTQHGQLVTLNMPGGNISIHADTLDRCGAIAQQRVQAIFQAIEKAVKSTK